jgi:hypothetical protein
VPHHIRRATPLIAVDFEILALSDATTGLRALPFADWRVGRDRPHPEESPRHRSHTENPVSGGI